MTPERWFDVERLYHEALEHEPELRATFLDKACGPDSELLAEVRSLLDAYGQDSAFLEASMLQEAARQLASHRPAPVVGRRIGRYEILELLGVGGMGEVYHARDTVLERDVALKLLLRAQPLGTRTVPRLLREAQSAARLSHPNICTVHEVGSFEGRPFLAMEYVEGQTLAQTLKEGRLALDRVLDYGIQIARALAHAHERQILHKDLKTANVMVTSDHRIKVVDFGIARRLDAAGVEQATITGSLPSRLVAGTPAYMSPEVLRGEAADVRSDVWALGVLLYEMAAGTHPFNGLTAFEVVASIMEGPPRALSTSMPPQIRTIVQRCLAVDPAERFERVADVGLALEDVRAAVRLAPSNGSPRPARGAVGDKPRSRVAVLAMLAAIGLVAVALAAWWTRGQPRQEPPAHTADGAQIRLAILPFDVAATGEDPLLGLGLADSLITRLAGVRALSLRPTPAIRRFAGSHQDPTDVGRALRVDYLLYGTATSHGDSYDFTLQLVRASDGLVTWGHSFTIPRSHALMAEQLMGEKLTSALKLPMTENARAGLAHRDTANPEAHLRYVRGRALFTTDHMHRDQALQAFEDAVRLDPGYARAHAGIAHILARNYWKPGSPETAAQYRARATEAAERALRLDPNLAEAHEALSTIFRYTEAEWDKAIDEGRKALELDPTLELPHHNMATAFYHLGLSALSEQESAAGVQANPDSRPDALLNRARSAVYDGRYAAAVQFMSEVGSKDDPGYAWILAEARFYLGRREESERGLRGVLARSSTGVMAERARASLASLLAAAGRRREAEAMLRPLITSPPTDHHAAYRIATTYAQLARTGEAVAWLRRSAETGFPCYTWFVKDRLLDPVRQDPTFQTLMAQQRSAWEYRHARYAPVGRAF